MNSEKTKNHQENTNLAELVESRYKWMEKIHLLKEKIEELNTHIGDQNKTIDRFSTPLIEEGLQVNPLLKLCKQLKMDIYDLISVKYSTTDAFNILSKVFPDLRSSRQLSLFAQESGLNQNKFFMRRVGRTSYGLRVKSYTTLLFSLLGIFELAYLLKKKQENDQGFLETYFLLANKNNRKELAKSLKQVQENETVPHVIR